MYRSADRLESGHLPKRYAGDRALATSIYFLLKGDDFSAWHRLQSDEIWHFYTGCSLMLITIDPAGQLRQIRMGPAPEEGDFFQAVIPRGFWFGAYPMDAKGFCLIGCGVAPGFEFSDFELGTYPSLLEKYPQHAQWIERLSREK